jgi:hypothetical protein
MAKAISISRSVLARAITKCLPMARAPVSISFVSEAAFGLFGLTNRPMTVALGTSSLINSIRLGASRLARMVTPVTLPPGRLRLATRPIFTGSVPAVNTIGIVVVAALAASAEAVPPVAAITAILRRTSSAASTGSRLAWFSPVQSSPLQSC